VKLNADNFTTRIDNENGRANTKGSFEAGVDGALPGVQMPAKPTIARSS
jgi:hypothetical protein